MELPALSSDALKCLESSKPEVRKRGAAEVERRVHELYVVEGKWRDDDLEDFLKRLFSCFIKSIVSASLRKGGLLAFFAVANALGERYIQRFVPELVRAPLELFLDQDTNVRYSAAECLFNIAKVGGKHLLQEHCFGDIFAGICNLKSDNDKHVRSASDKLDDMFRKIATTSRDFNNAGFARVVKQHMVSPESRKRRHVLQWLEAIPADALMPFLPQFLGGIFKMLSDSDRKTVRLADTVLAGYLLCLRDNHAAQPDKHWEQIICTAVDACSKRMDEATRSTALIWIHEVLKIAGRKVMDHMADCLEVVLAGAGDDNDAIAATANEADEELMQLYTAELNATQVPQTTLVALLRAVTASLKGAEEVTVQRGLEWMEMILCHYKQMIPAAFEMCFAELVALLVDPSDPSDPAGGRTVELALRILANITRESEEAHQQFLVELLHLFKGDGYRHMDKAPHIIKTLANLTQPTRFLGLLAQVVRKEAETSGDVAFASSFVTNLSMILLTSPELLPVRDVLRRGLGDKQALELFRELHGAWVYNAVSLLGLCLLVRADEHAYQLVQVFGEMEVSVSMLVQLDRLVQLLESPVYASLRLALLEPEANTYLTKTMFGLLMLVPQFSSLGEDGDSCSSFDDLHQRLKAINALSTLNARMKSRSAAPAASTMKPPDWKNLLQHFKRVSKRLQDSRR
eukprot:TRINITY_DN16189_c0_g1_i1.p1 TRINITY_DN16189_c0_g1~~TRINITY_DN16189_c0_g1_i1.p1  ORF type:complete len:688 (+),score=192.69 TRINITY_DN16189_c0_g1_i1:139-2202(+)